MASIANMISPIPSTMALMAMQVGVNTFIIGFTDPNSWLRLAAFPVMCSCTYGVIVRAPHEMRTRWCGVVGGIAYIYFLQYLDTALLSRWSYETHVHSSFSSGKSKGNITSGKAVKTPNKKLVNGNTPIQRTKPNFLSRLTFGFNTTVSLRHTSTPHEVHGVPSFDRSNPSYVPSRSYFLAQQTLIALLCYTALDILDQAPPPENPEELFAPSQVPVFRRFNEITTEQWIVRVFGTLAFGGTFFSMIQLFYSIVGVIAVGSGLSDVASWKPLFGSLGQVYSLRKFWGKFWHQCLRQSLTSPATYLTQTLLNLDPKSSISNFAILIVAFLGSALFHLIAHVAGGEYDPAMLGVFQFFVTQICGIFVEDRVRGLYHWVDGTGVGTGQGLGGGKGEKPRWFRIAARSVGYLWVAAFMLWSVPAWVYPGASKPVAVGPRNMAPFSIFEAILK